MTFEEFMKLSDESLTNLINGDCEGSTIYLKGLRKNRVRVSESLYILYRTLKSRIDNKKLTFKVDKEGWFTGGEVTIDLADLRRYLQAIDIYTKQLEEFEDRILKLVRSKGADKCRCGHCI